MPNDQQNNNGGGGFDSLNAEQEPDQPEKNLSKNQKWAVAGLAVFAVLIVVLWSVQLKNNIYGPLNSGSTGTNETAQVSDQTASDLALKNKDTDSDGLNDYDELNIYKTSPYLEDSDGDKLKDGEEVAKGADPNCPAGRTCATSEFIGDNASTPASPGLQQGGPASSADTLNNLSDQSAALNSLLDQMNAANPAADSSASGDLTAEQKQALKGIDAASLRQLLIEAGMDKTALDQISDTELMQSYNETLNSPWGRSFLNEVRIKIWGRKLWPVI